MDEEEFEVGNYIYALISEDIMWPAKIYRKMKENNEYKYFVYLFGEVIDNKWIWLKAKEMKMMKSCSLFDIIKDSNNLSKTLIETMKEVEHNIRKDTYKLDNRNDDICFICRNIGFLILCDR